MQPTALPSSSRGCGVPRKGWQLGNARGCSLASGLPLRRPRTVPGWPSRAPLSSDRGTGITAPIPAQARVPGPRFGGRPALPPGKPELGRRFLKFGPGSAKFGRGSAKKPTISLNFFDLAPYKAEVSKWAGSVSGSASPGPLNAQGKISWKSSALNPSTNGYAVLIILWSRVQVPAGPPVNQAAGQFIGLLLHAPPSSERSFKCTLPRFMST